jgi:DNA replication protein DnaC
MRTEKKWNELKWKYLHKFPLRLQRDLKEFDSNKVKQAEESTFIYGDVKAGKTVMAAQMMMAELKDVYLHAIPEAHNKTLFVGFPDMLLEIKATYSSPESTEEVLHKYMDAYFLVLDDFITTRPTDWVVEMIYHLINYRYENLKKTIITSNYSLPELEDILHEQRITSRISRSYVIIKKQSYKE